jgi:hypothetical protein
LTCDFAEEFGDFILVYFEVGFAQGQNDKQGQGQGQGQGQEQEQEQRQKQKQIQGFFAFAQNDDVKNSE